MLRGGFGVFWFGILLAVACAWAAVIMGIYGIVTHPDDISHGAGHLIHEFNEGTRR